jgi:DNA repair protein RadC
LFQDGLRDVQVEEFHLLTLDSQSQVVREVLITRGLSSNSLVHPREVFRAAIAAGGDYVIIAGDRFVSFAAAGLL